METLALLHTPSGSHHYIYVDEYIEKSSWENYLELFDCKQHDVFEQCFNCSNILDEPPTIAHPQLKTFINLDFFTLSDVEGVKGVIQIFNSIVAERKMLYYLGYGRDGKDLERVLNVCTATGCFVKSVEKMKRRYGNGFGGSTTRYCLTNEVNEN